MRPNCIVRLQCRAITTARFPTISTASGSFNPFGAPPRSRRDLLRWFIDRQLARHQSEVAGLGAVALCRPSAGAGRRREACAFPMWATRAFSCRPPASTSCSTRSGRSARRRFARIGPKRVNDPGIAFADLPPIDVVLVSHGHYDHLDVATLSRLAAAHRPRIITPLGNDADHAQSRFRHRGRSPRLGRSDRDRRRSSGDARPHAALVGAQPVRPQHVAVGIVRDRGARRAHLFCRRFRLRRRAAFPRRARAPWPVAARHPADRRLRAALVHARPAHESRPSRCRRSSIAAPSWRSRHHYGTFQLTDEAIDAPLAALAEALQVAGIPAERFRTLRPGQVWEL